MSDLTTTGLIIAGGQQALIAAKEFFSKLLSPSIEEAGLIFKDEIAVYRFKNQIRLLNKTKEICEANGISPKAISPKLLLPLIDHASLEDDELLQDKWAILLSNLVDSEQNIENHVFPYLLSQISKNEFFFLERICLQQIDRGNYLANKVTETFELHKIKSPQLSKIIDEYESQINEHLSQGTSQISPQVRELISKRDKYKTELSDLKFQEMKARSDLKQPQYIINQGLRAYEFSNLTRLGLINTSHETFLDRYNDIPPLEYPSKPNSFSRKVKLDSKANTSISELGFFFMQACIEKKKQ